ncbi:hypothetical protein Cni_G20036 [Canna indica]|uniref:Uncharacterized protein n=1 Tax=Canna indica TaxID=4628 RepID=A0AAQ3KMF1_9LILI|nr:hypothetical protein Cni_G20036 [Canna indica]
MEVKPRTKPLPKDNTSLDQSKTQLRTKVTGMNESQEKDTNNAASHKVIKLSQRDQKGSATGSKSSQHAKYVPSKMKTVSKDSDHVQSNLRVKTAISTQSKNNLRVKTASSTQSKNNLRVKAAGSNQVRKKKLGAIFPEPEVEGIDAEDQLNSIDNLLEDRECMWLSSDSLSTKVKAFSKDGSHDQSKSSFKAKAASSNHARKKKSATIFPGLELVGLDAKDQLSFIDKLSDNVECMWLSSDSVSLISSEDSVDASEVDYMNVWMPSLSKNSELPLNSNSADIVAYQDNIQNPYSDSDEPLYWPFDQSLYNSVDVGNFLCQPPCKDESNVRDADAIHCGDWGRLINFDAVSGVNLMTAR